MKKLVLFLLFLFIGLGSIMGYKQYTVKEISENIKTPISHITPFSLAVPPPASLKGIIASFSGPIEWQAREATEPAELIEKIPVLQGQDFWTKKDGTLSLQFPQNRTITVSENTHLELIQTLPESFVLLQDNGVVLYANNSVYPMSIRVSPLLVQQKKGIVEIKKDNETEVTTITVRKGTITIGFNNTDNTSNVVPVAEGDIYIFDNPTRTGEITSIDE